MTTSEEILKSIVKELHEMNKKLDRMCRASIFKSDVGSYKYVEDGKEDHDSQEKHIV